MPDRIRVMRMGIACAFMGAGLVAIVSQAAAAQADPLIGTWKLNVAKSSYTPGPAPKATTLTYTAASAGLKAVADGTPATGAPTKVEFTITYDGKDHPAKGSPDFDASAYQKSDGYTTLFTRKKKGKVVQHGTRVLSKDLKTLTVTTDGTNASGAKVHSVAVYEKQG